MQTLTAQQRQAHRRRKAQWDQVGPVLEAAAKPMTMMVSITWSACHAVGPRDRNILGLPEAKRISTLWDRLRRVAAAYGEKTWIAARAPEHDRTKGLHLHLGLRMPASAYEQVIQTVERLTGVPAAEKHLPDGITIRRNGRTCKGVLAHGEFGAWMVQRNTRPGDGGTGGLLRYVGKAPKSPQTEAQFRLSNDILKIVRGHSVSAAMAATLCRRPQRPSMDISAANHQRSDNPAVQGSPSLYGREGEVSAHFQASQT